jgi:FAD binding domain
MTEVQIRTLKGGTIALSNDILTALHSELHGSLCLPDEAGYDEARTIWNAMIDRRPGAVVRCRAASDVIGAVRLARDNGLLVAARGGGHNIAGNAVCDGGLLIDLSPMRSVHIDSKERIARVEPGVTRGFEPGKPTQPARLDPKRKGIGLFEKAAERLDLWSRADVPAECATCRPSSHRWRRNPLGGHARGSGIRRVMVLSHRKPC